MARIPSIALVDYGVGNLHSARKGLEAMGARVVVSAHPETLAAADGVVLPGVGAFDAAIEKLAERDLGPTLQRLVDQGQPLLGICLGLQVLFESSEEGRLPGLGILPGRVRRFASEPGLTIPHMGWNQLEFDQPDCPLWQGLAAGSWVYFVHSYYVEPACSADRAATAVHGHQPFTAAIARDRLWAVQFHPEKSARTGLQILKNFIALTVGDRSLVAPAAN
ncbi:imidazole glycerol phosphate synthase subunit HisH [Gloeobacter kilaueensis]|uniref:Imidazole glycerol phosphate synthase subunit HisH n=1 Tax=Gloeobacter kilaueensis (strain ATCC BAA-2537 / CCAP 1431/1 / ULC 316 / JS1) TaxID=1183438 RepID=U5QNS1_GLOK1|nr:imidazole glycerol phosphate synthase subunit HisH [Gloeobacter kilaueensis]AGY60642.1 imidazole glycerol phosphate synthase subunit HisH [Gloeobacter kilaueensis JS1]